MTIDQATLAKCIAAIPALGKVHAMLTEFADVHSVLSGPSITPEQAQQAAAALWYFPELLAAAKMLNEHVEALAKGQYHSMEISKEALALNQEQKALILAIQAIGEAALERLSAIESGDVPPTGKETFDRIAGICEKVMGA